MLHFRPAASSDRVLGGDLMKKNGQSYRFHAVFRVFIGFFAIFCLLLMERRGITYESTEDGTELLSVAETPVNKPLSETAGERIIPRIPEDAEAVKEQRFPASCSASRKFLCHLCIQPKFTITFQNDLCRRRIRLRSDDVDIPICAEARDIGGAHAVLQQR